MNIPLDFNTQTDHVVSYTKLEIVALFIIEKDIDHHIDPDVHRDKWYKLKNRKRYRTAMVKYMN